MRRSFAALTLALAVVVLAGFAPPAVAATVTYEEPVSGRIVEGFRPPATTYGRGNRGLTYEATDGSPVRASAPGRVSFAGQVGGALHVVVQHDDGVRTSYSFLKSLRVRKGQLVAAGDVIGSTADTFHFGARIGDAYIDPAILLSSGPARVHLIPDAEFSDDSARDDRSSLHEIVADRIASVARTSVDWAKTAADAAVDSAAVITRLAVGYGIDYLDDIVDLGQWAGPFTQLAASLATIAESFMRRCTPTDLQPPTSPARRRIAVFVAGLGSSSRGQHQPGNLSERMHANKLGYQQADVYDFSYKGGRNPLPYAPKDTVRDLREDAMDLRDLLDRIATENPGVPVDVIAHSQGGLIAREAMSYEYDGPRHQLPPVEHLITLGTPHHGADAATANAWLRWSVGGRAVRALARAHHTEFDLLGPGVAQLSETSDFINAINRRPLREGTSYTSISGARDLIVPAPRARLRDATNTIINVGSPTGTHSALPDSREGQREVALAINGMPPTCQDFVTTVGRAAAGAAIASGEDLAGAAVAQQLIPNP